MKKILCIIPLLAVPVLLCGARGVEPQPVPIVTPSPVPIVEEAATVAVPDCKAADPTPKPQPEQDERYPGVDLSALTDAEREIVTYLLDRGMTIEAACGILANINRETGATYDPCIRNSIGATGLCQWLGSRLRALWQRDDWDTVTGQLDFLLYELETSESATDLTGSAYDCGYHFARDFERTGIASTYTDRAALAAEYYEEATQ